MTATDASTATQPAALAAPRLPDWAAAWQTDVAAWLQDHWDETGDWAPGVDPAAVELLEPLRSAVSYAVTPPGKLIRPLLVAAAAASGDVPERILVPIAGAVELIHTYSLVHDDLPAMDDDDLRRGRPTSHRAHGEAMAILVGDALQSEAFAVLATVPIGAKRRVRLVARLARSIGATGMVGGQALDVLGRPEVATVHQLKTGELMGAAAALGAIAAGAVASAEDEWHAVGVRLGELFQVVDDVLDHTASEAATGKSAGSDARLGRHTAVSAEGVAAARDHAAAVEQELLLRAQELPGDTRRFQELVSYVHARGA